jgi:hypothetical protein
MSKETRLADAMDAAGCETLGEYIAWRRARMTPEERAEADRRRQEWEERMAYCESCGVRVDPYPDGRLPPDDGCSRCGLCWGSCCRCPDAA